LAASTPAWGERAAVNFHLDPLVGTGLDQPRLVTGASLKIDTTVLRFLGPLAPQVEAFGLGALTHAYLVEGSAFGVGVGARLRLFNDERGYLWNPGTRRTGNVWGNAWIDAHLTVNSPGVGFDVGAGVELSLLEGLSLGPFAKFARVGPHSLLLFGLTITIGAPQTTPADADYGGSSSR
jgi:hypothetical protein